MSTTVPYELFYAPEPFATLGTDCNCACTPLSAVTDAPLPAATRLQTHPALQSISVTQEHHVFFVPSISRVAIGNNAIRRLLERFHTPQAVEQNDDADDHRIVVRQLYQLGILQTEGATAAPPPRPTELYAWLHVTNACNLRCTYCYLTKDNTHLSAETGYAAVDAIFRSALKHGYSKVRLKYAGGEASLNLASVGRLHRYAQEQADANKIELGGVILSNGVGLTHSKLDLIGSLGIDLMISLDGHADYHDAQRPRFGGQGSYEAVIASIERAKSAQIPLTVSITVTGKSIDGLPSVVDWLLVREIHFTLNFYRECTLTSSTTDLRYDEERMIVGLRAAYDVIARHPPAYSLLGSLLDRTNLSGTHERPCAVGENYLVIDQYGGVAKCQMEIEKTVTTVWAEDPLDLIRLDQIGIQNLPVDEKGDCNRCQWRYWCAGGCPLVTFRATGSYDRRSPNCAIYLELYPEVLRLEGLRLLHWGKQQSHRS